MHSHDRTLISRLGFADPDKGDSRHDLACQFLAQEIVHADVVGHFCRGVIVGPEGKVERPRFEVLLSKGDGKYKTTIGFIDLVLPFFRKQVSTWEEYCYTAGCKVAKSREDFTRYTLGVEVKVTPVGMGEVLRQINFYREYWGDPWLVATDFAVSAGDLAMLKSAKIHHLRLGDGFEQWIVDRDAAGGSDEDASTFTL